MLNISLTPTQEKVIELPLDSKIFVNGPAGTGKTTAGVERLKQLLKLGVPGNLILLWVPQRSLAEPYSHIINTSSEVTGGLVTVLTAGGLAKRMTELFWPMVSDVAGFAHPEELPTYLTLETAQYYMASLVRPMFDEGYFESVVMDRNRLYSQILDNLNKASLVGFPYTEIGERLKSAWVGDSTQLRIYDDAQYCASLFRNYCLAHNLLDYSLQVEVFIKYLWPNSLCRDYLRKKYQFFIGDNIEEDTPVSHRIINEWGQDFESILLINDLGGGYRRFLGADPESALLLNSLCSETIEMNHSFTLSDDMSYLNNRIEDILKHKNTHLEKKSSINLDIGPISYQLSHFYPQMLTWVSEQIAKLIHEDNVPPHEIVVLSPFLNDALRFALEERLLALSVPVYTHRPSRSMKDDVVTQSLLTIAALAHPQWKIRPSIFEFTYSLLQIIFDIDLVRAQLLAQTVFQNQPGVFCLSSFDLVEPDMQTRITYRVGELYERFRLWLEDYIASGEEELDHFFSRLFGELLSQPGYSFHINYFAGDITANMIESIRKFRWISNKFLVEKDVSIGKEYLHMVKNGVISALYLRSWKMETKNAVLLAPAYAFLMRNQPVDYQFWIDIGNRMWFERLYQPLTHPYVLNHNWPTGKTWTDKEEIETGEDNLFRLTSGLMHRCRKRIYLGISDIGEQGYENRGPLLKVIDRLLRQEYY